MNITFTEDSWQEYTQWQTKDKKIVKKINALLKEIKREPFSGLGKPEALRYELQGCWSRRITSEHRLVYEVNSYGIVVISCMYHY